MFELTLHLVLNIGRIHENLATLFGGCFEGDILDHFFNDSVKSSGSEILHVCIHLVGELCYLLNSLPKRKDTHSEKSRLTPSADINFIC